MPAALLITPAPRHFLESRIGDSPLPPRTASRPPGRRHFGLGLDLRCVYELDSSTPAKFSRHLTVRLPGHAFANNHAMGKFVAQVSSTSLRV